jgi:hypothetical protein
MTVPDKLVVVVFDPQVVSGLDPYQDLYNPQLRSRLVRVEALLQKLEYSYQGTRVDVVVVAGGLPEGICASKVL